MVRAIHWSATLHSVAEAIAMPACEEPAGIELGNLPAAIGAVGNDVAHEPWPLAAEAARRPADRYTLVNRLPILTACLDEVIEGDCFPIADDPDGSL